MFTKTDLRRAYQQAVDSRLAVLKDALNSAGPGYIDDLYYDAHDFAMFVGEYLKDIGVMSEEDVEEAIHKVKQVDPT